MRTRHQIWGLARGVVALALLLALGACGGGDDEQADADTGVVHVHGLGIDPADGVLYAATHHGVFRIPEDGGALRIADRYQDTMGFTVVGPRRFLASGHPSLDDDHLRVEGKPPLLGLIESTDAAKTWRPLSLLGDADFHGLVAAHGLVFGQDSTSGRFMVSADRVQWETRSQVQLISFAVSPAEVNTIVATTPAATLESRDGGRTWSPIAGAPKLLWLSWDDAALWGVALDSGIWRSTDGKEWTEIGRVPGSDPEALLAADGQLYVATDTGLHQSGDGGKRWLTRYRDPEDSA